MVGIPAFNAGDCRLVMVFFPFHLDGLKLVVNISEQVDSITETSLASTSSNISGQSKQKCVFINPKIAIFSVKAKFRDS